MRQLAGVDRIRRFMEALGAGAREEAVVYLTGGSSAVLKGWRASTIDIDLTLVPDRDLLLKRLPAIKEEIQVNVELASPAHFIPELPGWRERSPFIHQIGCVTFRHYDFYAQALAKIERGHTQDLEDVASMMREGLVEPIRLRELFEAIVPMLHRFPAVDPESFRRAVDRTIAHAGEMRPPAEP